jgi:hypothetical protein
MYIVREVMNCKPGKVREIIKRFKALNDLVPKIGAKPFRIMTDVSGSPFWTVVSETEVSSVDEFFTMIEKAMANEEIARAMAGYHDFVERGYREFYKLEA